MLCIRYERILVKITVFKRRVGNFQFQHKFHEECVVDFKQSLSAFDVTINIILFLYICIDYYDM